MPEAELPRREFLKRVGAAGLAVTLGGANAFAQGPKPSTPPAGAPAPAKPDSAAAAPPPPSEDAKALAGILQRRFPDRLTPAQWDDVTGSLQQRLEIGKRLAATKLENGDEPDFTFRP